MIATIKNDLEYFFEEFGTNLKVGNLNLKCVFNNEMQIQDINGQEYTMSVPLAYVKTEDTTHLSIRGQVIIDSTEYYVLSMEPDGTGMSKILLSEN